MAKKWVYLFSEGNATMRNLLGGKGANLAENHAVHLIVCNHAFKICGGICGCRHKHDIIVMCGRLLANSLHTVLEKRHIRKITVSGNHKRYVVCLFLRKPFCNHVWSIVIGSYVIQHPLPGVLANAPLARYCARNCRFRDIQCLRDIGNRNLMVRHPFIAKYFHMSSLHVYQMDSIKRRNAALPSSSRL